MVENKFYCTIENFNGEIVVFQELFLVMGAKPEGSYLSFFLSCFHDMALSFFFNCGKKHPKVFFLLNLGHML